MRYFFETLLALLGRAVLTGTADATRSTPSIEALQGTQQQPTRQPNGALIRDPLGPVIMLDFDGVLHQAQSGHMDRLPMLEAWLRENPEVDVVLSTNWRASNSMEDLRACFSADIHPRVLGGTPALAGASREDEIMALVQKYRIRHWAALDDCAQEFPRTAARHLVHTEYLTGLTPAHLTRLSELLAHGAD